MKKRSNSLEIGGREIQIPKMKTKGRREKKAKKPETNSKFNERIFGYFAKPAIKFFGVLVEGLSGFVLDCG